MSTVKPGARFLPTLTEVVQVTPIQAQPPKTSVASEDDTVLDLTQRAMALMEARIAERLEALMKTQAQIVLDELRDDIHQAVTEAVKQALRESE